MDAGAVTDGIARLLRAAREAYAASGPEGAALVPLIAAAETARQPITEVRPTALRHLDAAVALAPPGPAAELAQALARVAERLEWRFTYDPATCPHLAANYAYAELIGPRGFAPSDRIALGVMLMGPGVEYPTHRHPAVELYLVIAGVAEWQSGEAPPALRPPGTAIMHPSGVPHATRTLAEPLIALYAWTGNIATQARFVAGADPVGRSASRPA